MQLALLLLLHANLTVDGTRRYQTLDGVGVNINVNSWKNGELQPALDALIDQNGASLFRVIRDPMDWVSSQSQVAPLHALDSATLAQVYEQPKMRDLWATLAHLNQRGIRGRAVVLNFMGWTPTWAGGSGAYGVGSQLTPGKEAAWATVVASLVYYGRTVKGLDFKLLAPLNEQDWNCLEGPCLVAAQYVDFLKALVVELDAMGLTDIELVGPDCAGSPGAYLTGLEADPAVAARTTHVGEHHYGGSGSPGMSYPGATWWLTETAAGCGNCDNAGTPSQGEWAFGADSADIVLGDLSNGYSGVIFYDGYDSFYFHHNSYGYWGLLAYAQSTGVYTPRKRFWLNAIIARFARPGMVRIDETDSIAALYTAAAFLDPATGQVSIIGHNDTAAAITIDGQLNGLPGVSALQLWESSPTKDLQRGADVTVSGTGAFTASISANAFFALTDYVRVVPDAGVDAGVDAGRDAGVDAGRPIEDAGMADGGGAPFNDAGVRADAGSEPPVKGSCGCSVGSTPLLLLAALRVTLRRRTLLGL